MTDLTRERLAELRTDILRQLALGHDHAYINKPSDVLALIAQCEAGLPASGGVSGIEDGANTGGPSVVIMDPAAFDEAVRFLHPSNPGHLTPSPAIHRGAQLLRELYGTPKGGDAHPPEPNTTMPRSLNAGGPGVSGEDGELIARLRIPIPAEGVITTPPAQGAFNQAADRIAALQPRKATGEQIGRFGHHPDPVIDFEVETDAVEGLLADLKAGLVGREEVERRVERAHSFKAGVDDSAKACARRIHEIWVSLFRPASVSPAAAQGRQSVTFPMLSAFRANVPHPVDRLNADILIKALMAVSAAAPQEKGEQT